MCSAQFYSKVELQVPCSLVAWKPHLRSQGSFTTMLHVSPVLKKVNKLMQYCDKFDGKPEHGSLTLGSNPFLKYVM